MNFNKNYLGHEFEKYGDIPQNNYCYKCTKCKVLVFHNLSRSNIYWLIDEFKYFISNKYLELTCDEIIIKNIIE